MKLTAVKGVGQSAAGNLGAAGIETVEQLANIDQRDTDVTGLSGESVARLRDNARTLLEAVETGERALVEGLSPSAAQKLNAAGIETIDDLVSLDLRSASVDGLSTETVQKMKRNVEFLQPG